jgi:hypothetical protein
MWLAFVAPIDVGNLDFRSGLILFRESGPCEEK